MNKNLENTSVEDTKNTTSDIKIYGDGDLFKLLSKASSKEQGWMKSTKAMFTGTGCVIQVTTEIRNNNDTISIAEALTYVPGVQIEEMWLNADMTVSAGRKLIPLVKL